MELQKRNSFDSSISFSTQQLEVLILYLGYQEITSDHNIYQYLLIYINIPLLLSMQNKIKKNSNRSYKSTQLLKNSLFFLINDFLYRENGPQKLQILIC